MDFSGLFARDIGPDIAELARYASMLAGDNHLPYRSQFDIEQACQRPGYLYLVEALPEQRDYYFTAGGEHLSRLFGNTVRGRRLSDLHEPVLRRALRESYDLVLQNQLPLYMCGRYVWPDHSIRIERLLIPLINDEERINSICGLAVPRDISDAELDQLIRASALGRFAAQMVGEEELVLAA